RAREFGEQTLAYAWASPVVPHCDVHRTHRARAGDAAEGRGTQQSRNAGEARRVRKILYFPAHVEVMPFLRAEAIGFAKRRVPVEFARAFDRAAVLVAVTRGCGRGKGACVEETERRAAADAKIRVPDLVGAKTESSAGAVVGGRAAQIRRQRIACLPGDDVLPAPIAEDF